MQEDRPYGTNLPNEVERARIQTEDEPQGNAHAHPGAPQRALGQRGMRTINGDRREGGGFLTGRTVSTSVSPVMDIYCVLVGKFENLTMTIQIALSIFTATRNETVNLEALLDLGAGGNFVDYNYTQKNNLPLTKLPKPIVNMDGTENKKGTIKFTTTLPLTVNRRM